MIFRNLNVLTKDILVNSKNPSIMGFLKNEDQSIDLTELLICIIMKDWLLLPSRDIHVLRSFIPNGILNSHFYLL